jgi:RNA polymerase sigma-70 factor (ECF subfamily)
VAKRDDRNLKARLRRHIIALQSGGRYARRQASVDVASELLPILKRQALSLQRSAGLSAYGPEIADDAVSHAYIQFLRKIGTFKEPYDILAWFYVALRHSLLDERKRRNRVLYSDLQFLFDSETHDYTTVLSVAHQLREAIKQLNPDHRILIYLHYWKELSVRDIAKMRNVQHQAITSSLQRARAKLYVMLTARGITNGWADTRTS